MLTRRSMIQQVAAVTAGLLAPGTRAAVPAYGALHPTPSENGGEFLLALPEGFRYTGLSRTGAPMSDGNPTPRLPDGMASFFVNGEVRLVCNHEVRDVTFPISAGPWQYDGMTFLRHQSPRIRRPGVEEALRVARADVRGGA